MATADAALSRASRAIRRTFIQPAHLAIALVMLVALGLRLYHLDWDEGKLFHPDERFILMSTSAIRFPSSLTLDALTTVDCRAADGRQIPGCQVSPLKPENFNYGSLIFYALRIVSSLLDLVGRTIGGPLAFLQGISDPSVIRIPGRALSGVFDTLTVLLTYLIGARLYSRRVGLLGAAFVAFSALHIQLSHFYASDTPMTFFVTLVTLFAARYLVTGRRRDALWSGVAVGLALATKVSAAPILAVAVAAPVLRAVFGGAGAARWAELRVPAAENLRRIVLLVAGALIAALIAFAIVSPYAFIATKQFVANVLEQNSMVRGVADLPYTRQYADRTPYLYFIQNLVTFGFGMPLGLAVLIGTAYVALRNLARPRPADVLLLSWVVPYFLITGSFHAKFLRYMLPITPILALFAAVAFDRLLAWLSERRRGDRIDELAAVPAGVDGRSALPMIAGASVAAPAFAARWERVRASGVALRAGYGLVGLTLGATLFYGLAFLGIYDRPHTAVEASRWIYDNVPRGARIATEHWEEGMPVGIRLPNGRVMDPGQMQYRNISLNLYENDDQRKVTHIAQSLTQADYIVYFSNRLYGTIPRLPARYPVTTRYYQMLFGEELGFELVGAFTSYPSLLGIYFVDDTFSDPGLPAPRLIQDARFSPFAINVGRADESFTVYDHPKVLVFKKTREVTEASVRAALEPYVPRPGQAAVGARGETFKSLLLAPEQRAVQTAGGSYRDLFNSGDLANAVPVLAWGFLIVLLGAIGWPLAFATFKHLPDRGAAVARILGTLLVVWLGWMIVSLGIAPATTITATVALLLALTLAAAVGWRQRSEIRGYLERQWRLVAITEVVFWFGFVFFLLIRIANPDLWHPGRGGEKPMDIAYLMAAIKSTSYPPYDPWFAGGYLNYYYFGQIVVATLVKLSGVVPTTSYNVVVPYLFALTFAGSFGVGLVLARRLVASPRRAVAAGISAAFFVTVFGNIGGLFQLGGDLIRAGGAAYRSVIPGLSYVVQFISGLVSWLVGGKPVHIGTDWYWTTTRVIQGTINEFPFFTFLYADLHAHLIGLPFTLLALAFAVDIIRSRGVYAGALRVSSAPTYAPRLGFAAPAVLPRLMPVAPRLRALADLRASAFPEDAFRLTMTGMAIGVLQPINSWDFPTYLGIVSLAGLIPWYLSERRSAATLAGAIARIGAIAALTYVLFWPFHANFQSFYSGIRTIPDKSNLGGYLIIHGFFLAAILTFLAVDALVRHRRSAIVRSAALLGRFWDRPERYVALHRRLVRRVSDAGLLSVYGLLALVAVVGIAMLLVGAVAGLLFALLALTALLGLRRDRPAESTFLFLMIGTGLALGLGCELVAIDGDIGRMNTVFKFYLQVWVLWGIVAAVGLWAIKDRLGAIADAGVRRAWVGVLVFLLIAAAVYPVVSTRARVNDRFNAAIEPGLDGTAYMLSAAYSDSVERPDRAGQRIEARYQLGRDLPAFRWIWENVDGSPVVLEANTPLYRWGSRVSIYTGLPTVIGWDWHQKQQRAGYVLDVDERLRDVRQMYSDPSPERVLPLLQKYQVRYVYVGEVERAYYPAEGLAKFDRMAGQTVELVYDAEGVKIYRVRE